MKKAYMVQDGWGRTYGAVVAHTSEVAFQRATIYFPSIVGTDPDNRLPWAAVNEPLPSTAEWWNLTEERIEKYSVFEIIIDSNEVAKMIGLNLKEQATRESRENTA